MSILATDDPIGRYRPSGSAHDEMIDRAGAVRAHWAKLVESYRALGATELARRQDEISLLLEQDGVTYNVADDRRRPHRPWELDPLPLVLPSDEWAAIERGMTQRAELLDLVLRDVYGERKLLRSGVIPPELVLGDPSFLRACDRILLPSNKQLVVYGIDLTRGADGSWKAIGNRTQAPSGAAYALENRRILSRVFPSLFRNADVHRLAPFVRSLRAALQGVSPVGVDDPSIVVLSPGSLSETAFEHAFIATQLGYPLVQGSDLEVRDGQVWLRSVGEQMPVHVILRRLDAWFCDPLELNPESTLGVAGLTDACRAGAVSVVNTLGSGVLENAALATRLPMLARTILGSDLELESVPSWWCGDTAGRSHVVANLGELVLRPSSRIAGGHSIDTALLSSAELEQWRRRIEGERAHWVGQERFQPTTAPVLADATLRPRDTVVRTFAVARDDSYVVMSGGLARTANDDSGAPIANRAGAISKDIWVLSSEPETLSGFWLAGPGQPASPPMSTLPARAAENLFWLGRYAERAESTLRLLRTINARRDEFQHRGASPGPTAVAVLLDSLTRITGTYPGFVGDDRAALHLDPDDELFALVVDESRPGTVAHAVRHMLDAVDELRDQLSVDTWLVIGSLQRELDSLDPPSADRDEAVTNVLSALLQGLLALSGLAAESMVRDQGWHFMDAGRRLERALQVCALVGCTLADEHDPGTESLVVESTLTAAESIITYRRRYRSRARASTVLDLLLTDAGNPRSLRFQIDRLHEDLLAIHAGHSGTTASTAPPLVLDLAHMVHTAESSLLADADPAGRRVRLDQLTSSITSTLRRCADAVGSDNFTRFVPQHSVVTPAEAPERAS